MEALAPVSSGTNGLFKLLLFIDKRPNSTEQVRRIRQHLKKLQEKEQQGEERQQDTTQKSLSQSPSENLRIGLEIIDVSNQPYLAEHFKLVATPALIKVSADKHQVLAGSDIATQLEDWWPRWQKELEDGQKKSAVRRFC